MCLKYIFFFFQNMNLFEKIHLQILHLYNITFHIYFTAEFCPRQSTALKYISLCRCYAAHELLLHDWKIILHDRRWFSRVQIPSVVEMTTSFVKEALLRLT